ncbi:strictosidine synthase [Pseudarthrobacter sp.]|uniref:strictosidine synthase n=1 Tax=Pseudarthrobacter sp. TaxID=1934409 RepID=UPI002FCA01E5
MGFSPPTTGPHVEKHFTSSVLLWVRSEQSRQTGMDYWKGPHSGIIAATPGLEEYRQIHLAEHNPGLWPATTGVETTIPADRKIDGIAEVTFQSALSPLKGRKQTALAYKDEVNVFRRTLLYTGMLKELRTQSFMPWIKKTWDTPNVAHDNPADQRFHASIILGFADSAARDAFFSSTAVRNLSHQLNPVASAIHAYEVDAALTYVKGGRILPHYEE